MHGQTITHQTTGVFGAARVFLKPASEGTGVIAGGGVRAVLELAGIHDVLSKSLGSQNPINLVKATVTALQQLRAPDEVAELRGLTVREVLGIKEEKKPSLSRGARRRRKLLRHEDHTGQVFDRGEPEAERRSPLARAGQDRQERRAS